MSMSLNIHDIVMMEAVDLENTGVLKMYDKTNRCGSDVAVFMDYPTAVAMAKLFNQAMETLDT